MLRTTLILVRKFFFRHFFGRRIHCQFGVNELHINGWSRFSTMVHIGRNANFNGIRTYGRGSVSFGDNFHSARGLRILTQNHDFEGTALPYDASVVIKDVVINDNVWVGMDVLILPGVVIGEGAIVQAGSVVAIDIPPLAIVGGSPARPIKYRDEEHYMRLKQDGSFF